VRLSDGSAASRAIEFVFSAILYVLPDSSNFADNDVFFAPAELLPILGGQLLGVSIYAAFLLAVCLVDFYRKEFNF